jgi:hypothetical protein
MKDTPCGNMLNPRRGVWCHDIYLSDAAKEFLISRLRRSAAGVFFRKTFIPLNGHP